MFSRFGVHDLQRPNSPGSLTSATSVSRAEKIGMGWCGINSLVLKWILHGLTYIIHHYINNHLNQAKIYRCLLVLVIVVATEVLSRVSARTVRIASDQVELFIHLKLACQVLL